MTDRRPAGVVDEAAAREVLLLQAFESVDPPSPAWTADDAAWATRAAREACGADDGAEAFVAARASLAVRRLLPRLPALAAAWQVRPRARHWRGAAVALGFVAGLAADAIGSSQRINLLAPPIWAVVAWNLAVYLLLVVVAARGAFGARTERPGVLVRLARRLLQVGRRPDPPPADASTGRALRTFAARWSTVAAPLAARRATVLLHAAAASLGAGLVAGLYARGLVLDYRVAWESTFLSPGAVHAALTTLLAPASALSGIALPDVDTLARLRAAHGEARAGAPAAPWIHLYAVTLLIAVVLPRVALAGVASARARRAAARVRLPFAEPYFRGLHLQRVGGRARVLVRPYAQPPAAATIAGVGSLLAAVLGDGVAIEIGATTPFGGEDALAARAPATDEAPTLVVALFDLAATPEAEHQGRFVTAVGAADPGAALLVLVDEAAFCRRFGAADRRLAERRAAWSRLFAAEGAVPSFASLGATPPTAAALASVRAALDTGPR